MTSRGPQLEWWDPRTEVSDPVSRSAISSRGPTHSMDEFTQHCLLPIGKMRAGFHSISSVRRNRWPGQSDFPLPIKCRLSNKEFKIWGSAQWLLRPWFGQLPPQNSHPPVGGGPVGGGSRQQNPKCLPPIGSCLHPVRCITSLTPANRTM